MPSTNLGQVRDKITAIDWTSNSASQAQGSAGTVDTYTVKTECSPSGAGTFTVSNGTNGTPGTNGINGTNGADAASLVGSGSLSIISGTNLKTFINGIGYMNLVSLWCRKTSETSPQTWYECSIDASFLNNGNPLNGQDINLMTVSYINSSGSVVNILETPTNQFGDYQFCCTYYATGDVVPQGYDLGTKNTLNQILGEALNLYLSGTFANVVAKFPYCFGKILNRNITIFPCTATNTTSVFLYLDNGKFGCATTPDAGTTWNKQEATMVNV